MNNVKVWPHLVIVAVVCAVLAGVGVGLWVKHERTAAAEALPNAARIQRIDGQVALDNSNGTNTDNDQWINATENQPFSVGDRIYTRENSHASLAFTGRNFARLNPNTSLDVLALEDRRTQLALRDGYAMFDVGYLNSGDFFEVATPYGAVDFQQPGLYNVGIDNGRVLVSVLNGLAQVVGMGGSGQISKGQVLTLLGATAADVVISQLNGGDAGYLVDDYYSYQYPRYYDGRYRDYNAYLNDPYYFDPYRRNVSYQYVNSYIPGLYDLDYYGDWRNLDGYGYAWSPRVDNGWAPYQSGYWYTDYPYGPTWVSTEPWGYAPYHYGRWAFVGDRWYWVPGTMSTTPVYSPALVAYVPFGQDEIGWVPLGPGDVYVPRYYNTNWEPYYLTRDNVYQRVVNLNVPNAVTVVSVDDFVRGTDWRRARKADRNMLAQVNPVLDPLLVTPLRNAVVHSAWGRGKIDIPPGIAKKIRETTVVTSTAPPAPRFRPDLPKTARIEQAPARAKGQKFQMREEARRVEQPRQVENPRVENPRTENPRPANPRVENPRPAKAERAAPPGQQRQQQRQAERVAPPAQQQRPVQQRPQPQQRAQGERATPPGRQKQPQAQGERVAAPQQQKAQPQQRAPKPEKPNGKPANPGQGGGKGKGKKP